MPRIYSSVGYCIVYLFRVSHNPPNGKRNVDFHTFLIFSHLLTRRAGSRSGLKCNRFMKRIFADSKLRRLLPVSLLSILFLSVCVTANAQYIERVYLKNGSIIRGTVIEQTIGQSVKIQTGDGSVFVYPYDDVEKITKDVADRRYPRHAANPEPRVPIDSPTPRYEGGLAPAVSFGLNGFGTSVGISTTHGCLINPYLYVGAGLGFNYFTAGQDKSLPVFGDIRTYFLRGDLKPYLNIRAGYDALLRGAYFSPSAGVRYRALDFSVGYVMNRTDILYYSPWLFWGISRGTVSSLSLNFGVRF